MDGQLAYRPNEACRVLGISRTVLFELLRDGSIRSVRIGKSRLIQRSEIEAFLNRLSAQ